MLGRVKHSPFAFPSPFLAPLALLTPRTTPSKTTQGFDKLREPKLLVRCRQVDEDLVQSAIKPAVERYKKQAGLAELDVSVDKQHYLAPPPNGKKTEEGNSWYGGQGRDGYRPASHGRGGVAAGTSLCDGRRGTAVGPEHAGLRTLSPLRLLQLWRRGRDDCGWEHRLLQHAGRPAGNRVFAEPAQHPGRPFWRGKLTSLPACIAAPLVPMPDVSCFPSEGTQGTPKSKSSQCTPQKFTHSWPVKRCSDPTQIL